MRARGQRDLLADVGRHAVHRGHAEGVAVGIAVDQDIGIYPEGLASSKKASSQRDGGIVDRIDDDRHELGRGLGAALRRRWRCRWR